MPVSVTPLTRRAVLVSAAIAAPLLATPAPNSADAATFQSPTVSTFDQHLVRDINNARASRGLRRLALVAGSTDIAHHWTCHLARYRMLRHNPDLGAQLSTHGLGTWTSYGE